MFAKLQGFLDRFVGPNAAHVLESTLGGTSAEGLRVDPLKRADVKKEVDALLGAWDLG